MAELKGYADTIPNKNILINAVTINEAKDSSEIENIITTHDELYKAMAQINAGNTAAKEVLHYRTALWHGYELIKKNQLLTANMIVEIQQIVEQNDAGIRKLPGTTLQNQSTGEIIYTPPSGEQEILRLMGNLMEYINQPDNQVDPLIKLAVIHYQFESIHPFYDGNGRTGRIINVLYLVLQEILDSPILYLSKYINKNKTGYYTLLQEVRTKENWEDWIIYMLTGLEETAVESLHMVKQISKVMANMSEEIKTALPKIHSKELLELLFYEFYTKIDYIGKGLNVSRKTASVYLIALEEAGFLTSQKIGKEKIYLNNRLYQTVQEAGTR